MLGFAGSLHCLGMCGPISLLLPLDNKRKASFLAGKLVYNFGRITTYITLGLIAGFVGQNVSFILPQKLIFISLGIVLLIGVLVPAKYLSKVEVRGFGITLSQFVRKKIALLHQKRGFTTQYLFGITNGLIPCGLVYAALSGAFLMANAPTAGLYMLLFGLGTLPMMMSFGVLSSFISKHLGLKPRFIQTLSYFILAIFFLYKGYHIQDVVTDEHGITVCMPLK